MSDAPDTDLIAERLAGVRERIARAGGDGVTVVGVTKFQPAPVCAAAVVAGLVDLGESYARELADKVPLVAGARWHFIGQLQTNKVRTVAGHVSLYQSVDRSSLVRELARRDPGAAVLVEVDLAGTAGRGGCSPLDAPGLIDEARTAGLEVRGVMGVAPQGDDVAVGAAFARLRSICDAERLDVCSMGMSGDYELAVREGSTMVRLGSVLFGERHRP